MRSKGKVEGARSLWLDVLGESMSPSGRWCVGVVSSRHSEPSSTGGESSRHPGGPAQNNPSYYIPIDDYNPQAWNSFNDLQPLRSSKISNAAYA